jgi:hypothetical protein
VIDFAEIEPNESQEGGRDSRHYGLSGYVLAYVEMFKRLVATNPAAAKAEFLNWPKDDPIFARLRIWAAGQSAVASADEFAAAILESPDRAFWPFHGERDLLLALSRRWDELSTSSKVAIEARILAGPERRLRRAKKDHIESVAHWQLGRLNWLASQQVKFTFDLAKKTIMTVAPDM